MKKILWRIGIGLALLIVIAIIVVALFLDNIVKAGVEKVGPQITKVSISLDEVHIGLLTGSVKVKGLVVGNPDGFKTTNSITVGLAEVGINPVSILSDKIIVRSIRVESPVITFEGGLGGNNLGKIMDNINGVAQNGGPVSTNTAAKAKPARKFEVDDILITGAKVNGTLVLFGGREVSLPSLPLPDIHLANLGTGPDGITATDLTRAIFQEITTATLKAVSSSATDLGKGAEKLGGSGLDKLKQGVGGLFGK
jgi:uncharacterized protein involved in outer membrane biogenesis